MKEKVDVMITMDAEVYKQATEVFRELGMTFEDAVLLFIHETVRQGRFPFELTEKDWEYVRKLEEAEIEAEQTDVRFSSKEVLAAMKNEIEKEDGKL